MHREMKALQESEDSHHVSYTCSLKMMTECAHMLYLSRYCVVDQFVLVCRWFV